MTIVTVGIDLAKSIFAVHGVDEFGKLALVRPEVPHAKLLAPITNLPACLIGMEACSGAHHCHWNRAEKSSISLSEVRNHPAARSGSVSVRFMIA